MILPSFDEWSAAAAENAAVHKQAFMSQKQDLAGYSAALAKAKTEGGVNRGAFKTQAGKMGLSTSGRGKAQAIALFEKQTTMIANGELKKRTGALRNATIKDVAILKKSYTKMMADTKGTTSFMMRQFDTMGMRFKIVTTCLLYTSDAADE